MANPPIPKVFLDADFLLENTVAAELYHDFAADLPIIDYHCHLSPQDIASNRRFETLTEAWLAGDHYKWRAMRANGVAEQYITGPASDWAKFEKWAKTVPATLRNPLYHWTHLELQRYFGIHQLLNPSSAEAIYRQANEALQQPELRTQGILQRMKVELVCTTDDPIDELISDFGFPQPASEAGISDTYAGSPKVVPGFRPDRAILMEKVGFVPYIGQLAAVSGVEINQFSDLLAALRNRMDHFAAHGCRISDHGLEQVFAVDFTEAEADRVFKKRMAGGLVSPMEAAVFQSALLYELSAEYARRGWVQQFHLGALRDNNRRLMRSVGADVGCDSIGDFQQAVALSRFLNRIDEQNLLAKTILYNLNPADNEVFATMAGNFNDGSVPGKIQWGSAWWFLDQKDGMEKQLNTLSNMGLLARFVGMLTDSRSFLSFPRHEYFRRILCNLIGRDVMNGELPHDLPLLGKMVQDVCYFNAKNYFQFHTS